MALPRWTGHLDAACITAKLAIRPSVGVALQDLSSRGHGSGQCRVVSSQTGRVMDQCQSYTQWHGGRQRERYRLPRCRCASGHARGPTYDQEPFGRCRASPERLLTLARALPVRSSRPRRMRNLFDQPDVSGHSGAWLRSRAQCDGGTWWCTPRSERMGESAKSDFHIRGVSSMARLARCALMRWSTSTR